ncbi:hypothetical protein Y032_0151g2820 [Ancylostoma ceylanicum]|uniref:Uncharacterized protein n=1 Tax=Ancylostoma ceylanicum TaxID=53326 RepID=A0A016T0T7_9BILA|nr:hypothetical protein Y032_0151g2820 [Ancylostoma ceylanicum]
MAQSHDPSPPSFRLILIHTQLQTAVDKRQERGAAFLGRDNQSEHESPCVSAEERRATVATLVYDRLDFTA